MVTMQSKGFEDDLNYSNRREHGRCRSSGRSGGWEADSGALRDPSFSLTSFEDAGHHSMSCPPPVVDGQFEIACSKHR